MDIVFKEYLAIIWQKKWAAMLVMIALSSATILDLCVPLYYKQIANALALPYSSVTFDSLMENLFTIGCFFAAIWLSWRFVEVGIIPLDGGGVNLLEKRCFAVLQRQRAGFFEDQFSGSLIKQASRFANAFELIIDWFLFHFFQNCLALIVAFIIFYRSQPVFAYYFLVWALVFVCWNVGFSMWKLRFDKAVASADSVVGGTYSDAISNIFVVKSFALERSEQRQVNRASNTVYQKKRIAWILMFASFAVQGILTFTIELLFVYLMIQQWRQGRFEIGNYVLFQTILLMLIQRLWEFGRNIKILFSALADAVEMAEIFRQDDYEQDAEQTADHRISAGEIRFQNLCFTYQVSTERSKPDTNKLFDNFSLTINAGEKIALVGASGSGKTTLTKLLFRFIQPQSGQLLFDGIDAQDFSLRSLRQQISLVPQQPELFHRSIRDNISLGSDIDDATLNQIARNAGCLDFIQQLPEQFSTMVGERGVKLSGGEKQRIAIARAFLKDAPIVVLDEATSALDSLTEQHIQRAIFELIKQKTAIVIAHRLSTILRMDRIIVLDGGGIIEQGSHQQLMANKAQYYAMWQHQSGSFLI